MRRSNAAARRWPSRLSSEGGCDRAYPGCLTTAGLSARETEVLLVATDIDNETELGEFSVFAPCESAPRDRKAELGVRAPGEAVARARRESV